MVRLSNDQLTPFVFYTERITAPATARRAPWNLDSRPVTRRWSCPFRTASFLDHVNDDEPAIPNRAGEPKLNLKSETKRRTPIKPWGTIRDGGSVLLDMSNNMSADSNYSSLNHAGHLNQIGAPLIF